MTLTEFLEAKNMTRQEFAAAVGVDPVSVYRWENGTRLPIRHFNRITEITDGLVTANDFMQSGEAVQ